jgi:hypothetical protein
MDGDTGWHIRTGEWILAHRTVPFHDLFSFSRPDAPWFAWEWLSDILFAGLHSQFGLSGVTLFCGLALVASAVLLTRQMARAGANGFLTVVLTVLAVGACSVHYHARPHVFTLLFLALAGNIVSSRRHLWTLVPLMWLWTGLHGGFLVLIAYLGLTTVGMALERRREWRRYAVVTAACAAVTLLNPYGIGLHKHIFGYLQSSFIADLVQEFQSPSFRSEAALQYELLLFAGIGCAALALKRGRYAVALPVLYFAHASLVSLRHVPLFVIVAVPVIASELTELWQVYVSRFGPRSVAQAFESVATDTRQNFRRITPWAAVLVFGAVMATPSELWPGDFPSKQFPVQMVAQQKTLLTQGRLLTSDQWGDYLIYHLYPNVRVYVDGRSDFYGETIGKQYLSMMQLDGKWREYIDQNRFDTILAPTSWPLVSALRLSSDWREVAADNTAVLFTRTVR